MRNSGSVILAFIATICLGIPSLSDARFRDTGSAIETVISESNQILNIEACGGDDPPAACSTLNDENLSDRRDTPRDSNGDVSDASCDIYTPWCLLEPLANQINPNELGEVVHLARNCDALHGVRRQGACRKSQANFLYSEISLNKDDRSEAPKPSDLRNLASASNTRTGS